MRKSKKKQNVDTSNVLNQINKNLETIANNSEETNKKLASFKNAKKGKLVVALTLMIGIVGHLADLSTVSGVTVKDIMAEITADPAQQYELYLSSEYYKLEMNANTDILATLNFDATSVHIVAYLNSNVDGDILEMKQKNKNEWQKKVCFQHTGIYTVVATATTPEGNTVEGYVEIEVIPAGGNITNPFF